MNKSEIPEAALTFRHPTVSDGTAMWQLVRDSGALDLNSPYAYLMACRNFADTCLLAEGGGAVAGMVLAYRQPASPDVLFVWQIGVGHDFRGRGLARTMLRRLVAGLAPAVAHVETTITPSNRPSQALFRAFARDIGAPVTIEPWLSDESFPGHHEAEDLYRIGPFQKEE